MAAIWTLKNLGLIVNVYYALKITKEAYDGFSLVSSACTYVGSWIWSPAPPPSKSVVDDKSNAFELVLLGSDKGLAKEVVLDPPG